MSDPRVARVLIVDDSAVMRSLLRSVVSSDKRLEVAGTANDGASALLAIESLRPDLVLLDVEMPVMDGLSTLKAIKTREGRAGGGKTSEGRVPVIMCSALTQSGGKVTIEALASGAADYVTKPSGQASREAAVRALTQDLIPRIIALTSAPASFRPAASPTKSLHDTSRPDFPAQSQARLQPPLGAPPAVVLVGVSTGGPAALDVLLPALPASFPLPVLVVQHMPELFTRLLAERLDTRCPLRVVEARSGDAVRPGTIYIAKGDWHMEVVSTAKHPSGNSPSAFLRLTQEPPENHCRPAVDVLFRSAAAAYGASILAVVLTGMGSDGLAGSRLIRESNGTVFAQDRATSAVWGMPAAVVNAGLAQRVLPLNEIAPEILRLVGRDRRQAQHDIQREAIELREPAV